MYLIEVTLGSGATPILPQGDPVVRRPSNFQTLVIGATAHTFNIGDASVTSTTGVPVPTTSSPIVISTPVADTETLSDWYLFGTANDKVPVLVIG